MSRLALIICGLLLLPYGYLVYMWTLCGDCRIGGHEILYTLLAVLAVPFVLAAMGMTAIISGARTVRRAAKQDKPVASASGGIALFLGVTVLVAVIPACISLAMLFLDQPESGRDRLGRICETEGSVTHCRPDPDREHASELEKLNEMRRRGG